MMSGYYACETLRHLPHLFERGFVFYGRGITVSPRGMRVIGVRDALLDVTSLLLNINCFAFDVELFPDD